jgi:hypothetical protein
LLSFWTYVFQVNSTSASSHFTRETARKEVISDGKTREIAIGTSHRGKNVRRNRVAASRARRIEAD